MANSTGSGAAADAGTATDDNVVEFDEAAAEKAYEKLMKDEAKARVAGAKARVEKLEDHLAGAKQALADAIAQQKDN